MQFTPTTITAAFPQRPSLLSFGDWLPGNRQSPEETFKQAMERLTDEEHFRFLYLPYMIMDVYFDHVDTVLTLSAQMRIEPLKKVCRAVKELLKDYRYFMSRAIDQKHLKQQNEHMEIFLDGYNDKLNAEYQIIRWKIKQEKPDLHPDWQTFLACVYMTIAIFRALQDYCRDADRKIAETWRPGGHTILVDWVPRTHRLMRECLGDSDVLNPDDLKSSGERIYKMIKHLKWEGKIIR